MTPNARGRNNVEPLCSFLAGVSLVSITKISCLLAVLGMDISDSRAESLVVIYDTPQDSDERDSRVFIEEEGISRTVSDLVNQEFVLRYELSVFLGGVDGLLFDESFNEIKMPYIFVYDIAERFNDDSWSRSEMDVYSHGPAKLYSGAMFGLR